MTHLIPDLVTAADDALAALDATLAECAAPLTRHDPAILASVLASNRPRLMAIALSIAAVTAPIMIQTPRKK